VGRARHEETSRGVPERAIVVLAWGLSALAWTVSATAQAPPGKKDEGAWVALLLLPVMVLVSATLQMAVMSAFPRFARRCATAVARYRWQTPLAGLAALLAVALLAAVTKQLAGGSDQAGLPVVGIGALVGTMGGVGVSLVAGRWAVRRVRPDAVAHPLLEILAGVSLLGWAMILLPCVGQVLWLLAACASQGAFWMALLLRHRLDETPRAGGAPAPKPPEPAPVSPTDAEPAREPERPPESGLF